MPLACRRVVRVPQSYRVILEGVFVDFLTSENILTLVGIPSWFFEKFGVSYLGQNLFLILFFAVMAYGAYDRRVLRGVANRIDHFSVRLGKIMAWLALIMVLQQILVVAVQYTFKLSNLTIAPFGMGISQPVQWWSEELRLYNSMIIVLCAGFTFVQGGHVRVDLIYGGLSFRAKRTIDFLGTLILMFPMLATIWKYGILYAYRSVARFNFKTLEFKSWKFEQSSNPSGFNEVYLFKILIPILVLLMVIQGISAVYRALNDVIEGEPSTPEGEHDASESAHIS